MLSYSIEDQQTHDYKKEITSNPKDVLKAIKSRLNNPLEGLKKITDKKEISEPTSLLDTLKSAIDNKGKGKETIPSRLSVLLQDEPDLEDSDLLEATSN
jgi:hypothetical protein